jgi:hypothetical protein
MGAGGRERKWERRSANDKLEGPDLLAYRLLYELIAGKRQAQDQIIKGMPRKL